MGHDTRRHWLNSFYVSMLQDSNGTLGDIVLRGPTRFSRINHTLPSFKFVFLLSSCYNDNVVAGSSCYSVLLLFVSALRGEKQFRGHQVQ